MRHTFFLWAALPLLLTPVLHSQNAAPGRLRAGAAMTDITPKDSDLAVSTDSIRDHLFARAIVVDDGSTCAVLVGFDSGAASNQIVDDAIGAGLQGDRLSPSELHHLGDAHPQLETRAARPGRADGEDRG